MVLAIHLAYWQQTILKSIGVLLCVLLPAGAFVNLFLFKMSSFMQSRLGPMEAGPHGQLQLLAEVGKSLQKEDIVPAKADEKLFKLAPYLIVASVLLVYVVVPFGPDAYFTNLDVGIFYALAVSSISVIGIDPEQYSRIVPLPDKIVAGTFRMTNSDMIVGVQFTEDMGVQLGDKLRVATANGASLTLNIVGIVDLGSKGANQRATYVALRTAQSLLNLIGGVTTIDLTVQDIYAAETLAQEIQASIPVEADSWIKTNAQFFTAVHAQQTTNTLIRVFVGLSVAFGIAAVLAVSVIQRSKDIGILRAMGTSRGQILRVFLIQGGLLGLLGSVFGSAMGAAALVFWHNYARQVDGSELFPLILDRALFIASAVLATVTGVAAAITPALRAANLDPVVAIRG